MHVDNDAEETKRKAAGRGRSKQPSSGLPTACPASPAGLSNRRLTIAMILMTTCQTRTPMYPQWNACWQLQPLGPRTQPHLKLGTTKRNGPGRLHVVSQMRRRSPCSSSCRKTNGSGILNSQTSGGRIKEQTTEMVLWDTLQTNVH